MKATNRQKKLLNFCKIRYSPNISTGAAGWEIAAILSDEGNREKWRRYLFLTGDFDSDSSELKGFSEEVLARVEIPKDWSASVEMQRFHDEVVASEMADGSPFDDPPPQVQIEGRSFMFTGKFSYGDRETCQNAVIICGGRAPAQKTVSGDIDYLVIGREGSSRWKRGSYGNKIESAILCRREHGAPAIISESHWVLQLSKE